VPSHETAAIGELGLPPAGASTRFPPGIAKSAVDGRPWRGGIRVCSESTGWVAPFAQLNTHVLLLGEHSDGAVHDNGVGHTPPSNELHDVCETVDSR
jgi:hypothetical protein